MVLVLGVVDVAVTVVVDDVLVGVKVEVEIV